MSVTDRVRESLAAVAAYDAVQPQAWISRFSEDQVLAAAARVDESLALAGLTFAVKDNIDVAGLPTTAACPAFAYTPERSATISPSAANSTGVAIRMVAAATLIRIEASKRCSGMRGPPQPVRAGGPSRQERQEDDGLDGVDQRRGHTGLDLHQCRAVH